MKKSFKIIAGCQDPGGCNAIYPVVKELCSQEKNVILFASKYSVEMFKRRNISFSEIAPYNFEQIGRLFDEEKPDMILIGTSMGYSLEDAFIEEGRKRNIPSIAILDSWVNYSTRFLDESARRKLRYLPDLVCVMDDIAKREMITEGIPSERIRVTGNPYFDDIFKEVNIYPPERKRALLKKWRFSPNTILLSFFSQRIDKTFGSSKKAPKYLGYTQFDALILLIKTLTRVLEDNKYSISLVVRPHPKEQKISYKQFGKTTKNVPLVVSNDEEPREILAVSDIITGMFSTVLVEAYILGKNILSIQPSLSLNNPFILSRLGVIKTATCFKDMITQLNIICSNNKNNSRKLEFYQPGMATANIINIINEIR